MVWSASKGEQKREEKTTPPVDRSKHIMSATVHLEGELVVRHNLPCATQTLIKKLG